MPQKVSTYSTGNHGIGLAWASKKLNINARIYLPQGTNHSKISDIKNYEAEIVYTKSRHEAEKLAYLSEKEGFHFIPPSDNDYILLGASTLYYEALQQTSDIDAIFASCGGGGLISGAILAKKYLNSSIKIFASEPENANDAYLSLKHGNIFRFDKSPDTIADGLRTLSLSERTFKYLKEIDNLFLVPEKDILYWTICLMQSLNIVCEPSSAISMAAAYYWATKQSSSKKIMIIISGGNTDLQFDNLKKENYLKPALYLSNNYISLYNHI